MQSISEPDHWMAISLTPEGSIHSLSSSVEHLIGYSSSELAGQPLSAILGERTMVEISRMMRSALDWGVWEGEIVHRDRNGKHLRARAALTPLTSARNECAGFLLISDMGTAERISGNAGPLREVGAYLRQISHDLNNPLAVLMGFTQLILLDPQCKGKMRADVERLFAEVKRVTQMVEKLHSYARSLQEQPPETEQERAID